MHMLFYRIRNSRFEHNEDTEHDLLIVIMVIMPCIIITAKTSSCSDKEHFATTFVHCSSRLTKLLT